MIPQAVAILQNARLPLVCGLIDQSLEVQRAAVAVAKRFDACIDWTHDPAPFALQNALQATGMVSCTFGEIRERCDLVVLCSRQLQATHPWFFSRFIGDKPTLTIDDDPQQQALTLRFLRDRQRDSGVDSQWITLRARIDNARYPVILIDNDAANTLGDRGMLSLFRFVRSQNDRNHCRLVHLSPPGNTAGIQATLSAMTGGPMGITFRHGQPVYRGREFSATSLIAEGHVDAVLLVGAPPPFLFNRFHANSRTSGSPGPWTDPALPLIWISDQTHDFAADLVMPVARWGLDCDGTGLRDDGIPIQRPAIFQRQLPEGLECLSRLLEA